MKTMRKARSHCVDIAQCDDEPPRAFVWLLRRLGVACAFKTATFARFQARRAAGVGFAVQRLRDRRRAALFAEFDYFDFEALDAASNLQPIADVQRLRGFAGYLIDLDLAALDRLLGERACLEKACGPKPYVETNDSGGWGLRTHAKDPETTVTTTLCACSTALAKKIAQ